MLDMLIYLLNTGDMLCLVQVSIIAPRFLLFQNSQRERRRGLDDGISQKVVARSEVCIYSQSLLGCKDSVPIDWAGCVAGG